MVHSCLSCSGTATIVSLQIEWTEHSSRVMSMSVGRCCLAGAGDMSDVSAWRLHYSATATRPAEVTLHRDSWKIRSDLW